MKKKQGAGCLCATRIMRSSVFARRIDQTDDLLTSSSIAGSDERRVAAFCDFVFCPFVSIESNNIAIVGLAHGGRFDDNDEYSNGELQGFPLVVCLLRERRRLSG